MRFKLGQKIIDKIRGKKEQQKSYTEKDFCKLFCVDGLGGNFKKYILNNNMPEKLFLLKQNLDDNSKQVIDKKVEEFLNWPNKNFNNNIVGIGYESYLTLEEIALEKQWVYCELPKLQKTYPLIGGVHTQEVFKYNHGLKNVPIEILDYIRNKDFIDAGSFIGDSAIVLNEYSPNKIYCFEGINLKTTIINNLEANHIDKDKYQINTYLLGANNDIVYINDTMECTIYDKGNIQANMITIDKFVEMTPSVNLKLLKMDVEGAEFDIIRGGIKTLKEFRPIICAAIYHNPEEFFELKPYIEMHLENYNFKFMNLTTHECHRETMFLAYPKEIIQIQ